MNPTSRFALALLLLAAAGAARAAGLPAPPGLEAMWKGRDGASVRAALRGFVAEGERPDATASQRMDAGECAYWLGVQDDRAGRPDSALAQWRRAMKLRGDFDEGWALMDALWRRGRPADLEEARALAQSFAQQAGLSLPLRVPEAHARLAWALHRLGRSDSARAELRDWSMELHRRPAWTRRFADVLLAAHDTAAAWRPLVILSARARRRDPEVETLLVRAQHTLRYLDERRQLSVDAILSRALQDEDRFAATLHGEPGTVNAADGFPIHVFTFPAAPGTSRRAPLLFVLSPADTVSAPDSLVAALTRAGHAVALMAPRGSFGSVGPGAFGPDAWTGQESALEAKVAGDAQRVMDVLAKQPAFGRGPWIVGAGGERAPVALSLVHARKDVPALLLVAPRVPVVEVAEFRARLRAAGTRTFVQVSPEEPAALEFGDLLARDTAPGQVRVVDSGTAGRGAAIFRADQRVPKRLLDWLEERPAR